MKAIEVGGVADHVHILLSLPSTMAISKALQLIKGGSSKWIHETFPEQRTFCLAEGIWRVQREHVTTGQNYRLHPGTGSASSEDDISGGISGALKKPESSMREYLWK